MALKFIVPAAPHWRPAPPTGKAWLHEVKFDGWRIQLLKAGRSVAVYTRNGHNYSQWVPR